MHWNIHASKLLYCIGYWPGIGVLFLFTWFSLIYNHTTTICCMSEWDHLVYIVAFALLKLVMRLDLWCIIFSAGLCIVVRSKWQLQVLNYSGATAGSKRKGNRTPASALFFVLFLYHEQRVRYYIWELLWSVSSPAIRCNCYAFFFFLSLDKLLTKLWFIYSRVEQWLCNVFFTGSSQFFYSNPGILCAP